MSDTPNEGQEPPPWFLAFKDKTIRALPFGELLYISKERVTADGVLTIPEDAMHVLLLPVDSSNEPVVGGYFEFNKAASTSTSPPIPKAGLQFNCRDENGIRRANIYLAVPTSGAVHVLYFGW